MNILIINGPNLNLLGEREVEVYGNMKLEDIRKYTENAVKSYKVKTEWKQSNHEGELIDFVQSFGKSYHDALIINPGGYSHTSIALLDTLRAINKLVIEVHLSNTHSREEYRHTKLTAKAANSIIEGLGKEVYLAAILAILIKKGLWNDWNG